MTTIDKTLKEYFCQRADGGVFFDVKNYEDLYDFESFLLEHDCVDQIDREKLNELFGASSSGVSTFIKGIWYKIANLVKSGYRQIVSKFKSSADTVEKTIGNQDLQSEFYVTLPAITEPNLGEFEQLKQKLSSEKAEEPVEVTEGLGDTTSIKGYYNEALTACNQYES